MKKYCMLAYMDRSKNMDLVNAEDEMTQFQRSCVVEKISERFQVPVLKAMLEAFPFIILEFHSDNGSEYRNRHKSFTTADTTRVSSHAESHAIAI